MSNVQTNTGGFWEPPQPVWVWVSKLVHCALEDVTASGCNKDQCKEQYLRTLFNRVCESSNVLCASTHPDVDYANVNNTYDPNVTHHGRRRDMDAGDGSWLHVIGQVTEDDAVGQSSSQIAG